MRTDRGWRRFYATGWLVSAVVGVFGFVQWQAHLREVERRADEAERTREEIARRRADEERLRIARELHDSLTHSISVIKVQAEVAVHLARKHGEEPSDALLAIQEASSDAVRELRATLEVLRREEDVNGSGLDRLPALVERARSSGLPTTCTVRGDRRPLPPDGRPGGVPDRPGGADQRHPARRRRDRVGADRLRPRTAHHPGRRRRGGVAAAAGAGRRAARDARTGHRPRAAGCGRSPAQPAGSPSSPSCRWTADVVIRVLLVDDQPLIRSGFRALLDAEDDIEVVAEAANGREGVALAIEHLPDIVLMDMQMPVMDGIEATRRIADDDRLAGVHVVILTNYGLDEYVFNALRAGAAGFLVKDTEPADLLQALRVAVRGDALLAPSSPAG